MATALLGVALLGDQLGPTEILGISLITLGMIYLASSKWPGMGALLALKVLPVGSASALRETSMVFGAIIAALWLKETVRGRRGWGVLMVSARAIALSRSSA